METVFVGDLSFFATDKDLKRLFSPFGRVKSASVRRSSNNDSLHYGFVQMKVDDATVAFQALQGRKFMGRRLKLNIGKTLQLPSLRAQSVQVHVSFMSQDTSFTVNEELLDEVFSAFGEVLDCIVKQYTIQHDRNEQCGYGFVFFAGTDAVDAAIQGTKGVLISNTHFDCALSHDSNVRIQQPSSSGSPDAQSASSTQPIPKSIDTLPSPQTQPMTYQPPAGHSHGAGSVSSIIRYPSNAPSAPSQWPILSPPPRAHPGFEPVVSGMSFHPSQVISGQQAISAMYMPYPMPSYNPAPVHTSQFHHRYSPQHGPSGTTGGTMPQASSHLQQQPSQQPQSQPQSQQPQQQPQPQPQQHPPQQTQPQPQQQQQQPQPQAQQQQQLSPEMYSNSSMGTYHPQDPHAAAVYVSPSFRSVYSSVAHQSASSSYLTPSSNLHQQHLASYSVPSAVVRSDIHVPPTLQAPSHPPPPAAVYAYPMNAHPSPAAVAGIPSMLPPPAAPYSVSPPTTATVPNTAATYYAPSVPMQYSPHLSSRTVASGFAYTPAFAPSDRSPVGPPQLPTPVHHPHTHSHINPSRPQQIPPQFTQPPLPPHFQHPVHQHQQTPSQSPAQHIQVHVSQQPPQQSSYATSSSRHTS